MKKKIMNEHYPIIPRTVFKFFLQIISPYKWWYCLILLGPISLGIHPLLYNYALKFVVDAIANGTFDDFTFLHPIFLFVYAEIYVQLSWRLHNFASWRFTPYMYRTITDRVFAYVTNHSYKYFQENLSGTIISKIKGINDGLYRIHAGIESNASVNVIKLLTTGLALCFMNREVFALIGVFVVIKFPLNIMLAKKMGELDGDCQNDWYTISGLVADNITNIFNVFSFARRDSERRRIWEYQTEIHIPKRLRWWKYDFYGCLALSFFEIFLMAGVCFYVIHLKKGGRIGVGDITFLLITTNQFIESVWRSFSDIKDFIQRIAQAQAAYSIMVEPQVSLDTDDAKALTVVRGDIEFRDLSFAYEDGHLVFDKLSFTIKAGEKVGLVGGSGVGKSTLVSLIMKNFRAQSGDIYIDGQSICGVTADSLRMEIGYIPQEVILFHRSIEENIAYAKDCYTQEEVVQAARDASIHDFIMSLAEGYSTTVGERGVKLSGGQRQRIAIARAFLKNAPIRSLSKPTYVNSQL